MSNGQSEPPAAFEGDVYESADLPEVPRTFGEALATYASHALDTGALPRLRPAGHGPLGRLERAWRLIDAGLFQPVEPSKP